MSMRIFFSLLFILFGSLNVLSQTVHTISNGNWDDAGIWDGDPSTADSVVVLHDVNVPTMDITVMTLTMINSSSHSRITSTTSGARTFNVIKNFWMVAEANYDLQLNISRDACLFEVGGNITITRNHSSDRRARIRINNGATLKCTGNVSYYDFNNNGGSHQELYMPRGGNLIVEGDINMHSLGGIDRLSLLLEEGAYVECTNLNLYNHGSNSADSKDIEVKVLMNSFLHVKGNVLAERYGGRQILFSIGLDDVDLVTDNSSIQIDGDFEIIQKNDDNEFRQNVEVSTVREGALLVGGTIRINAENAHPNRYTRFLFYENSLLTCGGLNLLSVDDGMGIFEFYDNSNFILKGDLAFAIEEPSINPINFYGGGKFVFDGPDQFSVDYPFNYKILEITGGATVEVVRDVTIENSLILTEGKILFEGKKLNIPNFNQITGGGQESYVCNMTFDSHIEAGAGNIWLPFGDKIEGYVPLILNVNEAGDFLITHHFTDPGEAGYSHMKFSGALQQVSNVEYWEIETNSTDYLIELPVSDHSLADPDYYNNLRLAGWDANNGEWSEIDSNNLTRSSTEFVQGNVSLSGNVITTLATTEYGTLPLYIDYFRVKEFPSYNKIEWGLFGYKDVERLELMRSVDGKIFETIHTVYFEEVSSNKYSKYEFDDYDLHYCSYYYRLTEVDIDGKRIDYGLMMSKNDLLNINLFPNPLFSGTILNVQSSHCELGNTLIKIFNNEADLIFKKEVDFSLSDLQQIRLNLESGLYYVQIFDLRTAKFTSKKLIVL